MKVYVVVERGTEYDDEYYSLSERGGVPVKAFKNKKNAEDHAAELEAKRKKDEDPDEWNGGDGLPDSFYEVRETELADEDIVAYADAKRIKSEAKEMAKKASLGAFKAGAQEIFEKFPDLKSFGFTAYTPYFNDGDTCYYSVYADEPYLNGDRSYDLDCGYKYELVNGKYEKIETGTRNPILDAVEPISKLVYSFDKDDIEAMFGDHVRITVSRGKESDSTIKIETEEISHD